MNTKAIKEFIREELFSLEPRIFTANFNDLLPTLHEKRKKVQERGWWAPYMPKNLNLSQLGKFMNDTFEGRLNEEKVKKLMP